MTETAPAVTILDADHVKEKNSARSDGPCSMWRLASSTRTTATYQSAMWASSSSAARTCSVGTGACPTRLPRAFRGGWFHTGDLGRMDPEGFITLVDRKKDMIITGGENVHPIEVERGALPAPGGS